MFQGIIEQQGKIILRSRSTLEVSPQRPWKARHGESVVVNGVCLTASQNSIRQLKFDLGEETLKVTNLGTLKIGDWVNLERPLRLGEPIHGHLVLGHVETVGIVESAGARLQIACHLSNEEPVLSKGCIAIEGVSLTINRIELRNKDQKILEFCLIPETLKRTNLGRKKSGDFVNLETDYLAKLMIAKRDGEALGLAVSAHSLALASKEN